MYRIFAFAVCCLVCSSTFAQDLRADRLKAAAECIGIDHASIKPVATIRGFFSSEEYLLFKVDRQLAELPRQYGIVEEVFCVSAKGDRLNANLSQGPRKWKFSTSDFRATVGVIRFRDAYFHRTKAPTISVNESKPTRFPAKFAEISSDSLKLQFEPLAYKNTVGYWVNPNETPHWNFQVQTKGKYRVRILQGCGKGQGGSEISIRIGDKDLSYTVKETGQFQAFRWYDVGDVTFEKPTSGKLSVIVKKLAQKAVMDIREIRFEPWSALPQNQSQPNVVIFYTDDQGTLDAGCFGSRDLHTPNIDGLAHAGIRFTQAYAHTVCCPSRAMLMTGRVPQRSNVNNWTQGNAKGKFGRNMNLQEITIAEYLKGAGYKTALFGKWHLGAAPTHGPTQQGFDHFLGIRGGFIDNFNHHFLHGSGFHDLYDGTKEIFRRGEYFPDLVTNKSLEFISSNSKSPFLLVVPFNVPHYPEQADEVFEQRYAKMKQPRKSYAKIVSTTDERIGRILRKLDETRLRQNTIVIFMSDNGHSAENYAIKVDQHTSGLKKGANYGANGGGGNTGKFRGNKGTFFEGGIRVPAIISFPQKLPTGIVRDQPITACDWLPTILELCGAKASSKMPLDGQSLMPIILKNAPTHHHVMHWQWQNKWAVRKGKWKLIASPKKSELFSLTDEPPESRDHAKEKPNVVKELRRLHNQWIAETKD